MRTLLCLLWVGLLAGSGCAQRTAKTPHFSEPPTAGKSERLIVTLDTTLTGKVVKVNTSGRFVVLNFPIGHLPAIDQQLNVYRRGLKVGEVRVTGPQLDDTIIGDLVTGEVQPGDQVRDR
jgi:hypothetical protein